ncbi:hypothetical protein NW759_004911 [Fusarium solani]|nr:hypothetical protein NW759_004911 [Fusarium solani]
MCFAKWNQGVFPREIEAWASEGSLRWIRMVYNDGTQVTAGKKPAADTAVLQIKASQGDSARRQVQPYLARTERTGRQMEVIEALHVLFNNRDEEPVDMAVDLFLTVETSTKVTWAKEKGREDGGEVGATIGAEYSWEADILEVAVAQNKKKIEVTAK